MDELHLQINALVEEEHALRRAHTSDGMTDDDRSRLLAIETRLDQAWDLLRQRQALRVAGHDPADAHERSSTVVEQYLN